jgi:hypothetical protein
VIDDASRQLGAIVIASSSASKQLGSAVAIVARRSAIFAAHSTRALPKSDARFFHVDTQEEAISGRSERNRLVSKDGVSDVAGLAVFILKLLAGQSPACEICRRSAKKHNRMVGVQNVCVLRKKCAVGEPDGL